MQKAAEERRNHFVFPHRLANGEVRWVEAYSTPVKIRGKIQLYSIIHDITERKLTEEAVRVSEERLRRVGRASRVGIYEWNASRNTTYWSPEVYELFGVEPHIPASNEKWRECLHPEDRERVTLLLAEALTQARSGQSGGIHRHEYRVVHDDGTVLWLESTKVFDSDGGDLVLRGSVCDITARKSVEDALSFLVCCGLTPGEDFFQVLARYLGETLNMDFVCIDRLAGDGLAAQTEAMFVKGKFEDNVSYALKDTPCGDVVGKAVCCFPAGVRHLFPKDTVLQDMAAESYVGVTLWGHTGKPIGLIAVIGSRPLANPQQAESILKLVAVRAAGELERKQAEDELRKSEERLNLATSAGNIGVWDWNIANNKMTWDDTIFDLYGVRKIDFGSDYEAWRRTLHPEDCQFVEEEIQAALRGEREYAPEFRIVHPGGAVRIIKADSKTFRDPSGKALRMVGTNIDITERKHAEQALQEAQTKLKAHAENLEKTVSERTAKLGEQTAELQKANAALKESEERFRQMAENVREVFWLADADLAKVHYVSPAFQEIWGRSHKELYENPWIWEDAVHPEDRELVLQKLLSISETGEAVCCEYRIIRPDGSVRWILEQGSPVRDEAGRVYRIAGVAQDITERKQTQAALNQLQQELLKISEREKQLIAQEMHDGLCQHFAGTAMMSSLLHRRLAARQDPEADQAKEISDLLCTGVHEARNLSHGLHPVKDKEEGLMESLAGLAQTVTKLFHIQCTFCCDDSVHIEKQSTATHLFRIAQEATNNAMKHGQASKVLITLKNSDGGVSLSIRDNGIGIPRELPATKGMGMQIMNHRADVIGAVLSIRRAGKKGGTVVTCTLPARG